MPITQATIVHMGASRLKSTRVAFLPTITTYDDTPARRVVNELRFFAESATLEMRPMYDFDGKRWTAYGEAHYQSLTIKEAQALEKVWTAEILSGLRLDAYGSNYKTKLYY